MPQSLKWQIWLSCICDLHRSSWQCYILNPLSKTKDCTCIILIDTSRVHYCWAIMGTPSINFFFFLEYRFSGNKLSQVLSESFYFACILLSIFSMNRGQVLLLMAYSPECPRWSVRIFLLGWSKINYFLNFCINHLEIAQLIAPQTCFPWLCAV